MSDAVMREPSLVLVDLAYMQVGSAEPATKGEAVGLRVNLGDEAPDGVENVVQWDR
jgi:hypothetical protein